MQYIKEFIYKHKHLGWMLLFIPLKYWFEYCEQTIVPRYILHVSIDDKIPFIKEFIIPYIIWYAFVVYAFVYTNATCRKDYYKLTIFILGGMTICYTIYMIFPNGQDLRPVIVENDIFSKTIKFLYTIDTPTNVCPSIHVFNSIAANSALLNSKEFSKKKYGRKISTTIVIFICLSTVFIKQHSIVDGICGIILALGFYMPLYGIPNIKHYKLTYKKEDYKITELIKVAINY